MLFYDCSTLSVVGQFPGLGTMFGESFKPVSLVPLVLAFLVLAGFAAAVKMDGKHEYYKHLSSVFFVDTPKPEKVAMTAKLSATFIEMQHPQTKMTEILSGMDPAIVLVNATSSIP